MAKPYRFKGIWSYGYESLDPSDNGWNTKNQFILSRSNDRPRFDHRYKKTYEPIDYRGIVPATRGSVCLSEDPRY